MSWAALKWAMRLKRDVVPGSPYALAIVKQLAWLDQGIPFYVSVPYLTKHTGYDARTVRRALALLEKCGVVRATGQTHRNMRLFEFKQVIEPLSFMAGVNGVQTPTQTSGVEGGNGYQTMTSTSGVSDHDPSHPCSRPLTSMRMTPDVDVPQKVLKDSENKTGPVVDQRERANGAHFFEEKDTGKKRDAELKKMRAIVHGGKKVEAP